MKSLFALLLPFFLLASFTLVGAETKVNPDATNIFSEKESVLKALRQNQLLWDNLASEVRQKTNRRIPIGEHLSLQQAIQTAQESRKEFAEVNRNFDATLLQARKNLKAAYKNLTNSLEVAIPPKTDLQKVLSNVFSTSEEKEVAQSKYARLVKEEKILYQKKIDKINSAQQLQLAKLQEIFLLQKLNALPPYIERFRNLQKYRYLAPEEKIIATLGVPDPDRSRFPLTLQYKGRKWNTHWNYSGRKIAERLWKERSNFAVKGYFQLIDGSNDQTTPLLTVVELSHFAAKKPHRYTLQATQAFSEFDLLTKIEQTELPKARNEIEFAKIVFEQGYTDKISGIEFVPIPAGEFRMGDGDPDEKPIHSIQIKHFLMGKYEVTQEQWETVMGENPSYFKQGGSSPVEQVSWYDVQEFLRKLNERSGQQKFRLPTEAEWEYAARAGTQSDYFYGDDRYHLGTYAWFDKNSGKRTHPAGQKTPNDWGLYDMHGNVWEWTCSEYLSYDDKKHTECIDKGRVRNENKRTLRGGSWLNEAQGIRSANRFYGWPGGRFNNVGFRLVQD